MKTRRVSQRGFTLLEMMMAISVFMVISGAVLGSMAKMQQGYRTSEIRTTMQQRLRAIVELMDQEIGQAGLQHSSIELNDKISTTTAPYTLSAAITATGSQTVAVNSVNGIYVGQWLEVDVGSNEDPIQVMAVSTPPAQITATFGASHPATAPLYPMGIFPHGIMSDVSTSQQLVFFGSINGSTDSTGNGLFVVEYKCTNANQLTRTEWDLGNLSTAPTAQVLVDNTTVCYFCWPGIAAGANAGLCPTGGVAQDSLTIPAPTAGNPNNTQTSTMITQVGFNISVSETSPVNGNAAITVSKSFANIQPRNIIAADKIFSTAVTNYGSSYAQHLGGELQPDPTALVALSATNPW